MRRLYPILIGLVWGLQPLAAAAEASADSNASIDAMANGILGEASQPRLIDWSRSPLHVAAQKGAPLEANQYTSVATGIALRVPLDGLSLRLQVAKVRVETTEGARGLSQTRFRQWGRPSRWEVRPGLEWTLVEGLGYRRHDWLPELQLALQGVTAWHVAHYPGLGFGKDSFQQRLGRDERARLTAEAPEGMSVVTERYWLFWGLRLEVFQANGAFGYVEALACRWLLASEHLPYMAELTAGVGYAL